MRRPAYALQSDVTRQLEQGRRVQRAHSLHNRIPQYSAECMIPVLIRHNLVVVVSGPDTAGIIRRVPDKPAVSPLRSSPCLPGRAHLSKINQTVRGTVLITDNVLHSACQKLRGTLFHHRTALLFSVVQNNVAVLIHDLRIELRLTVMAQVGDRRVSPCQIQIGDAAAYPAKSQRLPDIRQNAGIRLKMIGQRRYSHLLRKVISGLRCYLCKQLDRGNVYGLDDRLPDCHLPRIRPSCIVHRRTEAVFIRLI